MINFFSRPVRTLERALIVDTIFTNELPAHRPVRPALQRTPRKPKTSSSGGTPSELVDLGLL